MDGNTPTPAEAGYYLDETARRPVDWTQLEVDTEVEIETVDIIITRVEGLSGQEYYSAQEGMRVDSEPKPRRIKGVFKGEVPLITNGNEIGNPNLFNHMRSRMCALIEVAKETGMMPLFFHPDTKVYFVDTPEASEAASQ